MRSSSIGACSTKLEVLYTKLDTAVKSRLNREPIIVIPERRGAPLGSAEGDNGVYLFEPVCNDNG